MSRRGHSRGGRYNFEKSGARSYGGDRHYSQHDSRSVTYAGRDEESGEYYNNNRKFGNYNDRGGRGGGKYRGRSRRPGGFRGGRGRGRGRPFRDGGHSSQSSRYTDEDGDVDMGGGSIRVTRRIAPYARPSRGNRGHQNERYQQCRRQRWSLITVVDAGCLDQAWLIEAIQRATMTQITPVQYYCDDRNASFCIEDQEVAQTIRDCSKKIDAPDGSKLVILKTNCPPPITDDKIPILKEVLSARYNLQECHLDASALFSESKLRENGIEIKPKFSKDMYILKRLIGEHISGLLSLDLSENRLDSLAHLKNLVIVTPKLQKLKLAKNELRHVRELDHISEWDLKELNIDRNPLCENYKSQSEYVSAMRDRFPNLVTLDNSNLPPPVKFDIEKATKLLPPILNYIPDEMKGMITQFVQQYFAIYDNDRNSLLQAYAEHCIFSLVIPTTPRGPPLSQYYSHSRNLSRMKNPKSKISTLRYTKSEVCSTLQQLPKTEHDISGFCVDVPLVSSTLLKFIIRGVFKERPTGREKVNMRAFSRSFLCLTDGVRLSIINEELYIRNTTNVEHRAAFAKPPVTPSPSPVPEYAATPPVPVANVTSPNKMEMIKAFSKESGMNMKYSEMCLDGNQWDYVRAGQKFLEMKEKGGIPQEAFAL